MSQSNVVSKSSASTSVVANITPRVELLSNRKEDTLRFTLSGVNVSIANSIRRVMLSDIPLVVFRTSPSERNKCTIMLNTCGLHNEIVKHRLSCVPIHIKDIDDFPLDKYIVELDVVNNTDTNMVVTTEQFKIKDVTTDRYLPQDQVKEIFPANERTGHYIDLVRLRGKPAEELQGRGIQLTCRLDVGLAREDGAYNAVSTCSYANTVDVAVQEAKLQQLKQLWKNEGKSAEEVEFEAENWKLLEGKRLFKRDSFDFVVETVGIYTNGELLVLAGKIMLQKLASLGEKLDTDKLEVRLSDSTIRNCYDVIMENEDYTLGKVIEYFIYTHLYETGEATYTGFEMAHPHDPSGTLRVAYREPTDVSTVKRHLKECVFYAEEVYKKMNKEFTKLMER